MLMESPFHATGLTLLESQFVAPAHMSSAPVMRAGRECLLPEEARRALSRAQNQLAGYEIVSGRRVSAG